MPDGSTGAIRVEYVYRTRAEFAALLDEMADAARAEQGAEVEQPMTVSSVYAGRTLANAKYLGRILAGWNLDEEFGPAALEQMCNELPGVAGAIIADYGQAMAEGRLGN